MQPSNKEKDDTPWVSWSYEEQGRFLDLWCVGWLHIFLIGLIPLVTGWTIVSLFPKHIYIICLSLFVVYIGLEIYWRNKK